MPDTPEQWNDKISLEMTYGEIICALGAMAVGMRLCQSVNNMEAAFAIKQFGQKLLENILLNAQKEMIAPFQEAWTKLYYDVPPLNADRIQ